MNLIFSWLLAQAKTYILANWKSTVIGIVTYICVHIPALAGLKDQILALAIGAIGVVAADAQHQASAPPAPAPVPVPIAGVNAVIVQRDASEPSGG